MFYTIRNCETFNDYSQCMELQRKVWHLKDIDITPLRLYIISTNAGGFTLGAFDEKGNLVGFLHTLPAIGKGRELIYYSHMLAVVPELQNSGIGRDLKLEQRRRALDDGIRLITWTFDPLQSRNAHLNINKLGCVVREYKENVYSSGMGSVFDDGIDSDRLMAEWLVCSTRVEAAINGHMPAFPAEALYVEAPYDYPAVRAQGLEEARKWRFKVREDFHRMFKLGLTVTAFERGEGNRLSRYYFTDWRPE